MAVSLTIITFRDVFQDEEKKKSRYSEDYQKLSAQIILDKQDMSALGIKDGQSLLVKNDVGSVIVAAKTSDDDPHPGLAFMINSPWSNQLIGDDTCNTNISGPKSISAQVSPSTDNITQISEIFQRILA
jgi:formylmethanofuran dehydrogenase subunit D